jgi:hypothetical protein
VGTRALAVVAATVVALVGCAGPDPMIERIDLVAPRLPGHVRVELVVVNRSGGHGQIQIEIRLREARSGRELAAEHPLELDAHQHVELIVEIPAPEGAYTAEARALYPD